MVNTFVESVGVQPCCQTMNGLVVPRWDLWMSNRGKARDFFESWLHVQMRDSPGCDLTYQVLVFLDRLFMAGLKLHGEDHRDVFTNPEDFLERMLRHEGQLGYTLWDYILHLFIDIYIYICVCVVFYVVLLDAEKAIQSPDLHTFWKTLWMCFLFHWEVFPWIQWGTMSKIRKYGLLTGAAAGGRRKSHVV